MASLRYRGSVHLAPIIAALIAASLPLSVHAQVPANTLSPAADSTTVQAAPTVTNAPPQRHQPEDPLQLRQVLLWENGAPGALGDHQADKPFLTIITPSAVQNNGPAVIVAPGGGYIGLELNHEGREIADWFAAHGVTAFVLRYRLTPSGYHHPAQLQDGTRAVRWVRSHAADFNIDPDRIGMIGFSAGGHLTTMVATQANDGDAAAIDPVERASSRLNFMVLCYPGVLRSAEVVTTKRLLGDHPDPATADQINTEKYITKDTPPTFIFHTSDDKIVPVGRVLEFYEALQKAGVPVEMHVFEHGYHGLGFALTNRSIRALPSLLENWLESHGMLWPGPKSR